MTSGPRKLVPRRSHHSLLELVVIVAVAIGLALLIQAFFVKPYRIPSESMEPTLDVGQRVLVSRFNYHFSDPDRGDIVVFHPPKGADSNTCGAQKPDFRARQRELHQADRCEPRRHALDPAGARGRERRAPEGGVHEPMPARHLQLPAADQDSGGSLFYDGRQSWRER